MRDFADFGIDVEGRHGPEAKTLCPQCSHKRIKKTDPCLSVNIERGIWNCHNCGWKGSLSGGEKTYQRPHYAPVGDKSALMGFFFERGISEPTLARYQVSVASAWMGDDNGEIQTIRFPYFRRGQVINIKYRGLDKKVFRQEAKAEKIFYGLDDIVGAETVFIVEGEIDKLSLAEAGITSVISVPDGAPTPPEDGDFSSARLEGIKFEFIANCWRELEKIKRFVIAVDNDAAGQFLAFHLTRRLGAERCFTVRWPEGCKDANDVLTMYGVRALVEAVQVQIPAPLPGMVEERQLAEQALSIYEHGLGSGASTGWESVDQIFKVATGMFNVVTGIPGHGKSEFIDNLMINTAKKHDWIWSVFSPENFPVGFHWLKIIEKWTGFPVFERGRGHRLSSTDIGVASERISKHIILNDCEGEAGATFEDVLEVFKMQILRFGVKGCIIDPWNSLDHGNMKKKSETQYINDICNQARRFCKSHDVALYVVVHPSKLRRNAEGQFTPPTPYDLAGSAHWRNRSDFILCVYRDIENEGEERDRALAENTTMILNQKSRHRHLGKIGQAQLYWDPWTARYSSHSFLTGEAQQLEQRAQIPHGEDFDPETEPRFPGFA